MLLDVLVKTSILLETDLRNWVPRLDDNMASHFCCTVPRHLHSPVPPARVPNASNSLFALAALPNDHPHAIKLALQRPQDEDGAVEAIPKSPKVVDKVLLKLGRRSCWSLRSKGKETETVPVGRYDGCDDDARVLSSPEVVEKAREVESEDVNRKKEEGVPQHE